MKPLTREEFVALPDGVAIRIIATPKGLETWSRMPNSFKSWNEALGKQLFIKITNDSHELSVKAADNIPNEVFGLISSDFGTDANVYLIADKCIYCNSPIEYWKDKQVCTECYRIQDET